MGDSELQRQWAKTLPAPGALESGDPGKTYKPAAETARPAPSDLPTARVPQSPATEATVKGAAPMAGGKVIPPAFDFIEEIGRGGMGIVYRARQGSLRREIAVKQILPGSADAEAESLFVSEALVTGALDHPNIVPVHELARTLQGQVLLAMKLVSGRSWRSLLHPRTEEEKKAAADYDMPRHIGILLSVSNAVGFAHSKGVIHRDLKPENVMVGEFGEVLVMDWGLAADITEDPAGARAPHKSTITAPSGTPCYMPPELAQGSGPKMGPWTDTYLLGAILHEIVTGQSPHRGRTLLEVLKAAVRSEPPQYPAGVPLELEAICRKAMGREPEGRYRTVREFREALEGFLRHRESLAISTAAEAALARCRAEAPGRSRDRTRLYAEFAEAVAGFKQARVLWTQNEAAVQGERRARLAYARAALESGDLVLAEAQSAGLDAADAEGRALREQVAAAMAKRAHTERNARLLRRSLVGATAVIILGLILGILAVKKEQGRTLAQMARTQEAQHKTEEERRKVVRQLAGTYLVRARRAADDGDETAAAVLFAEANALAPSLTAAANARFYVQRVPRQTDVRSVGYPIDALFQDPSGALVIAGKGRWPLEADERFVAASPDGAYVATFFKTEPDVDQVRIRRVEDGAPMGRSRLNAPLAGAAFSGDGRWLYSALPHVGIVAWSVPELQEQRVILPLEPEVDVQAMCESADGESLFAWHSGSLVRIPFKAGEPVAVLLSGVPKERTVHRLAPIPGGEYLAMGLRVRAQWFDLVRGEPLPGEMLHTNYVDAWEGTASRDVWITASRDGFVRFWSVPEGRPAGSVLRIPGGARALRMDAEKKELSVGGGAGWLSRWSLPRPAETTWTNLPAIETAVWTPGGRRFLIWAAGELSALTPEGAFTALTERREFDPLEFGTPGFAFSQDDRRVAVWTEDGPIRIIDMGEAAPVGTPFANPGKISDVTLLTDGSVLVAGSEGGPWIGDPAAGTLKPLAAPLCRAVPGTARVLEAAADRVGLREAGGAKILAETPPLGAVVRGIFPQADGKSAACLLAGGGVRFVGIPDLKLQGSPWSVDPRVNIIRFGEGQSFAVALEWTTPRAVWDFRTRRALLPPPAEPKDDVVLSPDGRRAYFWKDDIARLWNLETGAAYGEPIVAETWKGTAVFSPDGRRLAVGIDNTVEIWDAGEGRRTVSPIVTAGVAEEMRFLAGGQALMILWKGGAVDFHDVETGARIGGRLDHAQDGAWVFHSALDESNLRLVTWHTGIGFELRAILKCWDLGFLRDGETPEALRRRVQETTACRVNERGEVEPIPPEEWQKMPQD